MAKQTVPRHLVVSVMATGVRFCFCPYFDDYALQMFMAYANKSWEMIMSDCFTVALLDLLDLIGTDVPYNRIGFQFYAVAYKSSLV